MKNIHFLSYLPTDATMLSLPLVASPSSFPLLWGYLCLIGNFDLFQQNSYCQGMYPQEFFQVTRAVTSLHISVNSPAYPAPFHHPMNFKSHALNPSFVIVFNLVWFNQVVGNSPSFTIYGSYFSHCTAFVKSVRETGGSM